jgi:hypothetical protein
LQLILVNAAVRPFAPLQFALNMIRKRSHSSCSFFSG